MTRYYYDRSYVMKRREIMFCIISLLPCAGCLGFSTGSSSSSTLESQQPMRGSAGARPTSRRERSPLSGISDIKALNEILERANCPLNENQINTLQQYRTESDFAKNALDVLTDTQLEAVKSNPSRRRGGGGRRR